MLDTLFKKKNVHRKQTDHELIWDDAQTQTFVSSLLRRHRGVSIKESLSALFSFSLVVYFWL